MSVPRTDTTFADIEFNGKSYRMFNNPLNNEIRQKIHEYIKNGDGIWTSAPWVHNNYKWSIVDNKLYLNEIHISSSPGETSQKSIKSETTDGELRVRRRNLFTLKNMTNSLIGSEKMFANWVSTELKLLISKEELGRNEQDKMIMEREVFILSIEDGILKKSEKKIEKYQSLRF